MPVGREAGCSVGGNLRSVSPHLGPGQTCRVDIDRKALAELRPRQPEVNLARSAGRELPFQSGWFYLVFTMDVLIQQSESALPLVRGEIVPSSRHCCSWNVSLSFAWMSTISLA